LIQAPSAHILRLEHKSVVSQPVPEVTDFWPSAERIRSEIESVLTKKLSAGFAGWVEGYVASVVGLPICDLVPPGGSS